MAYEIVPQNLRGKFYNKKGEVVVLDTKDHNEERRGTSTTPPYTRINKAATQEDLKYGYEELGMRTLIRYVEDKQNQPQVTAKAQDKQP